MYDVIERDGAVVLRGAGELGKQELGAMAAVAAAARRGGLRVVLDLRNVSHLHYAGAGSFRAVRGVSAAVASRYVRDLVLAGAGGFVELYDDVEDALRAA
jgi:ATP phosphoribosyltransferase regulatory subunit HisZ